LVCKTLFFFSLVYSLGFHALGERTQETPIFDNANVSAFIKQAYTPTFDCPSSALNTQIDTALESALLSPQQQLQLSSMKTHGLICAGNVTDAQSILQRLLANVQSDRSAQYYLSAIFQYGFIYDILEKPERCDYFTLARDSAKGRYVDVHLSASLGYITECSTSDVDTKVYELYQLLVDVTAMDNAAALAHAHNRVGLFYATRGQQGLAAAQYMKAFETARDIYTNENLLSVLGSAVAAFQSTGNLARTKEALDKFSAINEVSGTKRTWFLQYFFEAAYYVALKDFQSLETSLQNWQEVAGNSKNPVNQGLLRWYLSELCLYKNNIQCLVDFLENEKNAPSSYINYISGSKNYLRFIVEANMRIDNQQGSIAAFEQYKTKMERIVSLTHDNYSALDLGRLHSKILNLEASLEHEERNRHKVIGLLVGGMLIAFLAVFFVFWRKYHDSKSYDNITGVLTNSALIKQLRYVSKPSTHCTNALVIFDIANFTEVNLTLGSTKSDFVLEQIAITLKKITRSSDLLGRLGPEQFLLCLVDIEEDAAQAFSERVKDALTSTFAQHNNRHAISVDSSMSIYCSAETFHDLDEILENMLLSLSIKADKP
jgi:diguanylate cyclase (GGDEF)-like protein